ncbi:MAG TPA: CheR family methyltransferase, partial [Burkholderiaceae bacterium]|nr:CheR family methyltransferase [Burkholderiaceae bacterium]
MEEIVRFRAQITAMMGLYFDESKFSTLAKVLHNRMLAHESDQTNYLDSLDSRSVDEIQSLARDLTVTETYFLRNIAQFNAYAETALPQRLAVRDSKGDGRRKVEVLSAGCASGEEPYSLAITIREHCPYAVDSVAISALDLNPAMLQKARRARYSNWSLRDISDEMKKRWFIVDGDSYNLCESIKKTVTFESRNLTQDAADFWAPER